MGIDGQKFKYQNLIHVLSHGPPALVFAACWCGGTLVLLRTVVAINTIEEDAFQAVREKDRNVFGIKTYFYDTEKFADQNQTDVICT